MTKRKLGISYLLPSRRGKIETDMPTIGTKVYSERGEPMKLGVGAVKLLVVRHRENIGNPTYALIHSKNHGLAPVLEAEGVTARYLNGVLANELWLGDELPGKCFAEPDLYDRKQSRGNVVSDSARTSQSERRRATKQAENVPNVQPNIETKVATPVTRDREQNGSVSKLNRGRPKVKQSVEEIQKLADEGLTTRQIADKLGMSHVTVSRRLKSALIGEG